MKLNILTNITINPEWTEELKKYVDWDISIVETTEKIPPKFNPYFKQMWADFDWLRSKITTGDIKCFCTTKEALRLIGVTTHIGMYDKADSDTKHDFYIGIPSRLSERAKANGFKSNFTWLVIHEYLHGEEKQSGTPDRVHDMQKQGRLKELLKEHQDRRSKLFTIKNLLEKLLGLLPKKKGLLPLVERKAKELVQSMNNIGLPIRITEGYRSPERQAELYAQGRTKPGAIVTNAKAGESYHNYGLAFDVVFIKQGYSATKEQWDTLGSIGERLGLEWGGRWTSFSDKPHFQLTKGYNISDLKSGNVDYSKFK